jgi:hypothetical protein
VPSTTVTMTENEPAIRRSPSDGAGRAVRRKPRGSAHSNHLLLVDWIWLRRHAKRPARLNEILVEDFDAPREPSRPLR